MNVRGYDKNKNYIGAGSSVITTIVGTNDSNPMSTNDTFCVIETKQNVHYLRFNDQSNNLSTQYMMVQGQYTAETIPSYVPHQEQNFPFDLKSKNLVNINEITSTSINPVTLQEFKDFEVGKTYTFSAKLDFGNITSGSGRIRLVVDYNDETPTSYIGDWVASPGIKLSIATLAITNNIEKITLQYQPNNTGIKYYDFQLEQGTTATDYEPYYDIRAMQGTEFLDDGIHNIRTQLNLKNKNWVIRQDYTDTDYVLFKQNDYETDIYKSITNCTHFPITSSTPSPAYNCIRLIKTAGYGINILIQKSIASTPEELKTWLTEQNVIVELELEQPDIIPYNSTQQEQYNAIKQARSYDDQTNITQTNEDLPFILNIEALKK